MPVFFLFLRIQLHSLHKVGTHLQLDLKYLRAIKGAIVVYCIVLLHLSRHSEQGSMKEKL
jgi:hypothetical protein